MWIAFVFWEYSCDLPTFLAVVCICLFWAPDFSFVEFKKIFSHYLYNRLLLPINRDERMGQVIKSFGELGSRLGSSIFLPHHCQPTAFWMATQSLTFQSWAAALPVALKCRSPWATEFFTFWLVRKYCVRFSPGPKRKFEAVGFVVWAEAVDTHHTRNSWWRRQHGEGIAKLMVLTVASYSCLLLNYDTS